jgi:hypothetical protein
MLSTFKKLVLIAVVLSKSTAWGDELQYDFLFPARPLTWTEPISLPAFDPTFGQLTAVHIVVDHTPGIVISYENLAPDVIIVNSTYSISLPCSGPGFNFTAGQGIADYSDPLLAFDGTLDFEGTSGITHAAISSQPSESVDVTSPSILLQYQTLGPITLQIGCDGFASTTFATNLFSVVDLHVDIFVSVIYSYVPFAAPFCLGDGTATACPCSNNSPSELRAGCVNSTGAGASLSHAGVASVSADTLTLVGNHMPNSTCLYLQGSGMADDGAGVQFGDGLRCIGGSVIRLGSQLNEFGTSQYPSGGDLPLSTRGGVIAGDVRFYQVWYRNSLDFCTSAAFNLSNGYVITWLP